MLSQLIREAKEGKKDLVLTWLDVANAYGSVVHQLIEEALRRVHVPEEVCGMIKNYYNDVSIRFTTKNFTTQWQRIERGIITGCTLSATLFALTMTMLVKSAEKETKGPVMNTGAQQKNVRL